MKIKTKQYEERIQELKKVKGVNPYAVAAKQLKSEGKRLYKRG